MCSYIGLRMLCPSSDEAVGLMQTVDRACTLACTSLEHQNQPTNQNPLQVEDITDVLTSPRVIPVTWPKSCSSKVAELRWMLSLPGFFPMVGRAIPQSSFASFLLTLSALSRHCLPPLPVLQSDSSQHQDQDRLQGSCMWGGREGKGGQLGWSVLTVLRAARTALPRGRSARQSRVLFITGLLPGAKLTPEGHEDATCLDFKCVRCVRLT